MIKTYFPVWPDQMVSWLGPLIDCQEVMSLFETSFTLMVKMIDDINQQVSQIFSKQSDILYNLFFGSDIHLMIITVQ